MGAAVLEFEVVRNMEALRGLRPQWDELWLREGGDYTQSFGFCAQSYEQIARPQGRRLHCLVGRQQGRLTLVWPLVTYRYLLWRAVRPLGPDNGEPNGILVDSRAGVDAYTYAGLAWDAVLRSSRADIAYLRRLPADSALYAVLRTEPWITWSLCEAAPFAQLRTETDWQAFCRSLRGRTTTKPDYLWRRMTRAGDAAVHIVAHGDSRCAAYIDWMLQHKQQWAQRHGIDTPWFFAPHSRQFLVATLAEQGAVQPFRLVVVSLDGAPVAMALVALSATCMHLVINAFDARYAKLSPGVVLMDYCIKWAFELRLDVDFSAGEQHYKDYWTRGASYRAHSLQVACSVWGLLGSWAKQGATQARERLALALSRRGGHAAGVAEPAE